MCCVEYLDGRGMKKQRREKERIFERRGGGEGNPHTHKKEKARVIFVRILAHRK